MLLIDARPHPTLCTHALGQALGKPKKGAPLQVPAAIVFPPELQLDGMPCLKRKPKGMPFNEWIGDTLVRCRGVMAALPRYLWPASVTEADSPAGRIVTLDPTRACGRAWWWLWRLKESDYVDKQAYMSDDWTCVYQTDGLESDGNNWLPDHTNYDPLVLGTGFDRISLAGFAVTVRYIPPPVGDAHGTLDRLPALTQRMLLELEAASSGSGPAILASMLVHSSDNYLEYESRVAHADEEISPPVLPTVPGRIVAHVAVTQTHSFRLGDLLGAYNNVLGDPLLRPTLPSVNGSVYEMTAAIARKVRALANTRILKLNMVPDAIVFCPHLVEDDLTGQLQAQGYGYEGMEAVKGVPYMWDFDPLYTKRVTSRDDNYDANCAYVTMMIMLLASVRAQYGETVSRIMANKVIGRSVDGKQLPLAELPPNFADIDVMAAGRAAREKATVFCAVLRSVLPSFAKEHDPTLGAAYSEVAKDFQDIVRSEIIEYWTEYEQDAFDRERPIFRGLVRYLSGSSAADSALFSLPTPEGKAEALLSREGALRVERRLDAVREMRSMRLRV